MLLLALVLAGCGDDNGEEVASLGEAASAQEDGSGAQEASSDDPEAAAVEFAQCMRDNGVEDMPDPTDEGIAMTREMADDPDFQSAREACQSLIDSTRSEEEMQQAREQFVQFAQCMRDNGIDMPDDLMDENGRVQMGMGGTEPPFDPNSPQFQAAMEACQEHLDGMGGTRMGGR